MSELSIQNSNWVQRSVIPLVAIVLMFFGALLCFKMLMWTIDNKFKHLQPQVATEITAEFRQRQLSCLARNIYFEAGSEPFEGKVAVAQVTLNRADSVGFPNDICRVVYQKNVIYEKVVCQFSWYCDRASTSRIIHPDVYDESMEVAKKVLLEGFRLPSLTQALYFHADYVNPGWKRERVAKIGRHIFYK